MLCKYRVWCEWKPGKLKGGRWEVGLVWEGQPRRWFSWDTPQGYVQFTQDNEMWAQALKKFIQAPSCSKRGWSDHLPS